MARSNGTGYARVLSAREPRPGNLIPAGGAHSPAALCPGWRIWYDAYRGEWAAQRRHGYFPAGGEGGRMPAVSDRDPAALVALVARQAELDLWYHPDWECARIRSGQWAAQWRGPWRSRPSRAFVVADSAAFLAAALASPGRL